MSAKRKKSPGRRVRRSTRGQVKKWVSTFEALVAVDPEATSVMDRWLSLGVPKEFINRAIRFYCLAPTSSQERQSREDSYPIKQLKQRTDELIPLLNAFLNTNGTAQLLSGFSTLPWWQIDPSSEEIQANPQSLHLLPAMLKVLLRVVSRVDEYQTREGLPDRKTVASRALVWLFLVIHRRCGGTDYSIAKEAHPLVAVGFQAASDLRMNVDDSPQEPLESDSLRKRVQRFREKHAQDYDNIEKYIMLYGVPGKELASFVHLSRTLAIRMERGKPEA